MKKTILLMSVFVLLLVPLVSAECTWWNPFTWGGCLGDIFVGDKGAYGICENETVSWTTQEKVYVEQTIDYFCSLGYEDYSDITDYEIECLGFLDNLIPKKEISNRILIGWEPCFCNSSSIKDELKDLKVMFFDYTKTIYHNKTVCKPTGAINYDGDIIAYKDFWCKIQGNYIVCYNCFDGRCQYGTGRCKSGETCLEIEIENDKRSFYNSYKTKLINRLGT